MACHIDYQLRWFQGMNMQPASKEVMGPKGAEGIRLMGREEKRPGAVL